jgi:FMN hydrolase / 5-amino-6-(5-phospho-D-ribitylamino)uracil phosphatase
MLDTARIRAISLDLDDTLWPIWPCIERAEQALTDWLSLNAPMTAALFANPHARHDVREHVMRTRLDIRHDLAAIRREAIRLALYRAGEDPRLAETAFDVFFAERNRVELYEDALPALEWLSARYPLIAISNGNADLTRTGVSAYFAKGGIHAAQLGIAKPDPRIFLAAAEVLGVPPEQVLHIGDDTSLDVLGAMSAGMQAIWINRYENLWTYERQPDDTVTQLNEVCDLLLS